MCLVAGFGSAGMQRQKFLAFGGMGGRRSYGWHYFFPRFTFLPPSRFSARTTNACGPCTHGAPSAAQAGLACWNHCRAAIDSAPNYGGFQSGGAAAASRFRAARTRITHLAGFRRLYSTFVHGTMVTPAFEQWTSGTSWIPLTTTRTHTILTSSGQVPQVGLLLHSEHVEQTAGVS